MQISSWWCVALLTSLRNPLPPQSFALIRCCDCPLSDKCTSICHGYIESSFVLITWPKSGVSKQGVSYCLIKAAPHSFKLANVINRSKNKNKFGICLFLAEMQSLKFYKRSLISQSKPNTNLEAVPSVVRVSYAWSIPFKNLNHPKTLIMPVKRAYDIMMLSWKYHTHMVAHVCEYSVENMTRTGPLIFKPQLKEIELYPVIYRH